MTFSSRNMHYVFNVEYFRNLDFFSPEGNGVSYTIKRRNNQIKAFPFPGELPFSDLRSAPGFSSFSLYTCYPGLLIGIGNAHDAKLPEAIKLGFSLDYVNGFPYLPGSSLKGILRSCFSEPALIQSNLKTDVVVSDLEKALFEHSDVFLGAYPVLSKPGSILEMEYITPHPDSFTNPVPISLMKVKQNVKFEFCFLLKDCPELGLTSGDKLELFKKLLLEMGVGAKTNVGFGRLSETPAEPNIPEFDNALLGLVPEPDLSDGKHDKIEIRKPGSVLGPCPKCGKDVRRNEEAVECSGNCGIQFRRVFGSEISDDELSVLLNGGAVVIPDIMDNDTKTVRPARVWINKEGVAFRQIGKKADNIQPYYRREWLD